VIKLIIFIIIFIFVLYLLIKGLLNFDLCGLLILLATISLILSSFDVVIMELGSILSIVYPPLAFVAIFNGLTFLTLIIISIMITESRKREHKLIEKIAQIDLSIKYPQD
jgi:hypothetical protein